MSQKIIPVSLRLHKNENWESKWNVDKSEYSNLLHLDLEIKKYFTHICNYKNLKLIKLNVIKNSKNINIYLYLNQHSKNFYKLSYNLIKNHLSLYYPNHNINLFIKYLKLNYLKKLQQNIGKIFFRIKRKKTTDISNIIHTISYSLYTKNIKMISYLIKNRLEKKKSHKKEIKLINTLLQQFFKVFSNFVGYRLQFKGRLNGSGRKKK